VHQTIQKVGHDLEVFKWNTAVAALMKLKNTLSEATTAGSVTGPTWNIAVDTLLLLLAPIAPHITEELWHQRGHTESVHLQSWPEADPQLARDETVTMVVQVNGKVRDRIDVDPDIDQEAAVALAMSSERVQVFLEGEEAKRVIAKPPNLVNVVV
jgi:leucyl-tRNA synthetase